MSIAFSRTSGGRRFIEVGKYLLFHGMIETLHQPAISSKMAATFRFWIGMCCDGTATASIAG